MLAFRFRQTLFTHTIAARDLGDANDVIRRQFLAQGISPNGDPIEQWHAPDAWTKRAVDAATEPGVIDVVPRWIVDSPDGPQELDVDDIPRQLSRPEMRRIRLDSDIHAAWLDACTAEDERGDTLKKHIAMVATERDPQRYALLTRALAGAWGLGPVPEWHAAILPALIALDIELADDYATPPNWFEMDRHQLRRFAWDNHDKPQYNRSITGVAILAQRGWRHACAMSHLAYMLHWSGRPSKTGPTRIERLRLGSREILRRLEWLPWEVDQATLDKSPDTCERAAS